MANSKVTAKAAMTDTVVLEALKLTGKSAQIRALSAGGKTRAEIVHIISAHYDKPIRYQHVRNVLVTVLTGKKEKTTEE